MMKESIKVLAPAFAGDRMVKQYAESFYLPAADHYRRLAADGFAGAKALAAWKARVREAWPGVKIVAVAEDGAAIDDRGAQEVVVGDQVPVTARVDLGGIDPGDVVVEAFYSSLQPRRQPGYRPWSPPGTHRAKRTGTTSTGGRCRPMLLDCMAMP